MGRRAAAGAMTSSRGAGPPAPGRAVAPVAVRADRRTPRAGRSASTRSTPRCWRSTAWSTTRAGWPTGRWSGRCATAGSSPSSGASRRRGGLRRHPLAGAARLAAGAPGRSTAQPRHPLRGLAGPLRRRERRRGGAPAGGPGRRLARARRGRGAARRPDRPASSGWPCMARSRSGWPAASSRSWARPRRGRWWRVLNDRAPLTIRANLLRGTREALQAMLAAEGTQATPTRFSPWGLTLDGRQNAFALPSFKAGRFEIQDEGSQLIALCCGARSGWTVVDACAGAGGKTLALAAEMRNRGTLWAIDSDAGRLDEARRRARRDGVDNLRVRAVAAGRGGRRPARRPGRPRRRGAGRRALQRAGDAAAQARRPLAARPRRPGEVRGPAEDAGGPLLTAGEARRPAGLRHLRHRPDRERGGGRVDRRHAPLRPGAAGAAARGRSGPPRSASPATRCSSCPTGTAPTASSWPPSPGGRRDAGAPTRGGPSARTARGRVGGAAAAAAGWSAGGWRRWPAIRGPGASSGPAARPRFARAAARRPGGGGGPPRQAAAPHARDRRTGRSASTPTSA